MSYEQLDDLGIIRGYQSQLEACLKQGELIKQVSLHVGNGRQHWGNIWWFSGNGLLVGFDQLTPENTDDDRQPTFWNAFCVTDSQPHSGEQKIISVEINLKMGKRAKPHGTLLKGEDGSVYLGHNGNIRVGKQTHDLKSYQRMKGRIIKVNKRDFIKIATFGKCDAFIKELGSFVKDVAAIRECL